MTNIIKTIGVQDLANLHRLRFDYVVRGISRKIYNYKDKPTVLNSYIMSSENKLDTYADGKHINKNDFNFIAIGRLVKITRIDDVITSITEVK